jgi:hypothetical protein
MSGLENKLISEMNSSECLYVRMVEWFGINPSDAREYIKNLSFSKYNRLMEATVDRNPSLTSGTTTSGDPKYSDDLSDLENLMKKGGDNTEEPSISKKTQTDTKSHNNFDDFDPDYIPSYIKNNNGDINFKKIKQGDRISYVDDYGKTLHGVVKNADGNGNYDIETYYGIKTGIEQGRLRTPRELAWRYKNKSNSSEFNKGKQAASGIENTVSNVMNKADALSKMESMETDEELVRMRELAGLPESATSGATGAGAVASMPSVIGDIDKRPSTKLQVRARMDRDNRKKRRKRKQGKEVK